MSADDFEAALDAAIVELDAEERDPVLRARLRIAFLLGVTFAQAREEQRRSDQRAAAMVDGSLA